MKGVEQLKVLYLVKFYDQIEYLNIRKFELAFLNDRVFER
jgi:hypothetical protein